MMHTHLAALWPPAWRAAFTTRDTQPFLVVSHPDHTRAKPNAKLPWLSSWHRMPSQLDMAIQRTLELSPTGDVYYGVNLGRPTCTGSERTRLKHRDILVVPGLLCDIDGSWGLHKGEGLHLPESLERLRDFLHRLPSPPTLIVDTHGGVHSYHIFPEPWVLDSPEALAAFGALADRFQTTVERLAQEQYAWTSNGIFTTDLSRVLRLPGTTNHKYGAMVTTLDDTGIRQSPAELSAWLDEAPGPQTRAPRGRTRPAPSHAPSTGTGTLDIVALAEHYGMDLTDKSAEEVCGSHPVHGSDTGTNVAINPSTQVWHCFRHSSGGGPLDFVAVCEGLLPCAQAKPGGLRGMAYVGAVALANDRWHAGIVLDERQARLETQHAADDALAAEEPGPQHQEPRTPEDPTMDDDDMQDLLQRAAQHHAPADAQPQRAQDPSDPVDTWLGPRSTWFGVPRARREVTV
jgi:hypothetical protein